MKHPAIATLLNFVIPGAGLWYLGYRGWGMLNLLVATAIVLGTATLVPGLFNEHMHYVIFAVAAGSAGLAHSMARGKNRNRQSEQAEPFSHTNASD